MKSYWKNINLKKITARLMAGVCLISSLCLGGNPFTVETFAADCSVNCSNYPISGANNDSETVYTWYRIKSQEEFNNLWTIYGRLVGKELNPETDRIPLMITGRRGSNAQNLMVTSPDNENHGKVTWGPYTFAHDDDYDYVNGDDGPDSYDLANNYFKISEMSMFDGWKCAQDGQRDVVVTRGLNGAFYLKKPGYSFEIHGKTVEMPYLLYTSSGTFLRYQNAGNATKKIEYGVFPTADKEYMCYWKIFKDDNNKGFTIMSHTYTQNIWDGGYWFAADYYTALNKRGLAITPDRKGWTIHRGVEVLYDEDDKKWTSDGYWYNDSSTVEQFELWYGVPNVVSTYNLKSVDGGSRSGITEESVAQNPLTNVQYITGNSLEVAAGKSWGLNPSSVYYLKKGKTLTINEGATLIVGRNTVLFLAGNITNNGKIIVQPGGVILTLDPTMISGSGAITGSGDLIVRDGGKLRINELTISGDFYNSGYAEVLTTLKNGSRYISNGGALYAGITCNKSDYIVQTESQLRTNIGIESYRVQTARKTDVIQKYAFAKGDTAVNDYVFSVVAQ